MEVVCIDDNWQIPKQFLPNGWPVKDQVYEPDRELKQFGEIYYGFNQFDSEMPNGQGKVLTPWFHSVMFTRLPDSLTDEINEALKVKENHE